MADRSAQQSKFWSQILRGDRNVRTNKESKLFIEAVCSRPNKQECIERLIASPHAVEAIKSALRVDVSASFINNTISPFLLYLSAQEIKHLSGGEYFKQLLHMIADPPTLWKALMASYMARSLETTAIEAFMWLLLELTLIPSTFWDEVMQDAKAVIDDAFLLDSPSQTVQTYANKIRNVLLTRSAPITGLADPTDAPGGRHDNDFEDFRKIAIYPTSEELRSKERPFFRQAEIMSEAEPEHRAAIHIDNQFRLLREEMLYELRDDLGLEKGRRKGKRASKVLHKLSLAGISRGGTNRRGPCSLAVYCTSGLEQLLRVPLEERKKYLKDNTKLLRHQSSGYLKVKDDIVAFASIDRQEDRLSQQTPVICLQIMGEHAFRKVLETLKGVNELDFHFVDTSFFAYEPVLKCLQEKSTFPLSKEILEANKIPDPKASLVPEHVIQQLETRTGKSVQPVLRTAKSIILDPSQLESLLTSLVQSVSLIQGPPGTGKSFIGALLAKSFHLHTREKILVLCYTNHALDQFLEDFLDIGIPPENIVRLGAKSTERTASLNLYQQNASVRRSQAAWTVIHLQEAEADEIHQKLQVEMDTYRNHVIRWSDIMAHLEFSDGDTRFFDAFEITESDDDMTRVGRDGKGIGPGYLYDRWSKGLDAGIFEAEKLPIYGDIWNMTHTIRETYIKQWRHIITLDQLDKIMGLKRRLDTCIAQLQEAFNEKNTSILRQKRVIGCTTTAAAKYSRDLQNAAPGVILVEEAGEILEAHILTAMSSATRQMVLIGDHKQLRPKVNNYELTVAKGSGYDLDRSLFERLVIAGYPHTTLIKQHRMAPPISSLVRRLTYPDLEDAAKTAEHAYPRGLRDRVVFFNHEQPEDKDTKIADSRDEGSKNSKTNIFEAETALAIVRYMAQQGYGTDKLVVLTPYLGQLYLLGDQLSRENDPVLNDLDSHDLVRAGLMPKVGSQMNKRRIRISTIDNYQGEESDIVIVSLTRSNKKRDIGFMAAPQRLNVLLSRARIAIILLGNASTFMHSRKGKEVWVPFLNQLKEKHHLYDGLPVKCERHPHRTALLRNKDEFMTECPDGGCADPCGTRLNCGQHNCPQRCHQLHDHSKMDCRAIIDFVCSRKHQQRRECYKGKAACLACKHEDLVAERKRQRNEALDEHREAKQRAYASRLQDLQDEIAHERRRRKDESEDVQRGKTIQQYQNDLEKLREAPKQHMEIRLKDTTKEEKRNLSTVAESHEQSKRIEPTHDITKNTDSANEEADELLASNAKDEWQRQKQYEGAENKVLDSLMAMVGLEEVKDKFLSIKSRIDTSVRQNIELKDERFGVALLGNPGTGKTTVARLYAQFLSDVGVIPSTHFVETTGSRLSNEGVPGCKKQIEEILNAGGGVFFMDEAYQLASKANFGGTQVLDFILAEVENQTGKIVFIIAGYNKQMEAFFAHNPGIPSRFPFELQFADYDDKELVQIMRYKIEKRYANRMQVEEGITGLYARIVARRIGRGRGREGFGNARTVENVYAQIAERQSNRLRQERRSGAATDDMLFTKEDMIGPEPSVALGKSQAYAGLEKLIGLKSVKESVQALVQSLQYNYIRELEEKPLIEFSLNRVFLGSPGTGKTSVAKLYGEILANIGFLSNGEVVVKNPSDFVGGAMGVSEQTTKGILASTVGKVLVIDEAYGLLGGGGGEGGGPQTDPYRVAVVDTIVAEVQSTPGEDRCVLLLGYKDQMEEMFQKVNPGLSRRFPLDSAFVFEDFKDEEMGQILDLKLKQQGFEISDRGRVVAMDVLRRARNRPHFGNAGEIDILLNNAKGRHQRRMLTPGHGMDTAVFQPQDFDEDYERSERTETNVRALFEGVIGCDEIVSRLEGYQTIVKRLKARNMDIRDQLQFNFLFRGPPGTGKTTTARKMGRVYYDMGVLATAEVVECSTTDLVGQYIGQTGPKTQKLFEKALGKVLFIDEAYRLAEGHFAKEAMDEIVGCITNARFAQKMIIILAGYDADINRLMSINPGLTSRFPEAVVFRPLKATECKDLLAELMREHKRNLLGQGSDFDISVIEEPSTSLNNELLRRFELLVELDNWANARDVQLIAKAVFNTTLKSESDVNVILKLEASTVMAELDFMIQERASRSTAPIPLEIPPKNIGEQGRRAALPPFLERFKWPPAPPVRTSQPETALEHEATRLAEEPRRSEAIQQESRDANVSDTVWQQLEADKAASAAREKAYTLLLEQEAELQRSARTIKEQVDKAIEASAQQNEDDEARRRYEQERIRHESERRALEAEMETLRRRREEEEEARRKEQEAQKKLRRIGVCPVGFRWIKQAGGYRCAGGSHWVTDAELECV